MNTERDKFLTEAMGECWHDSCGSPAGGYCCKCQEAHSKMEPLTNNDFSTWNGFGKLWEWAITQDWWVKFIEWYDESPINKGDLIHPDRLSIAVYTYLNDRNVE